MSTAAIPSSARSEMQATLRKLIANSHNQDRAEVEKIIEELYADISRDSTLSIIESAIYFDNIGDAAGALKVASIGVIRAESEDLHIKRKAHNTAGAMFSRVCDYEQSCMHLEKALSISIKARSKVYEFAAMCNIVSVLLAMGLLEEAKTICKRACTYPSGTQQLDFLHLQNAINGFRLFRHSNDYEALRQFNSIALISLETAGPIDAHWRAYIDAQTALLLSCNNKHLDAINFLDNKLFGTTAVTNLRAKIILSCAFASCAVAEPNHYRLSESKQLLSEILDQTHCYPLHREELLRKLVEVHESEQSQHDDDMASSYKKLLSAHIISIKHRQFYDRVNRESSEHQSLVPSLTKPYYQVAALLTRGSETDNATTQSPQKYYINQIDHAQHIGTLIGTSARRRIEMSLRTTEYDIAEDWALAADFMSDRTFSHGLRVGRVAGILSLQLGMTDEDSVILEMACRLHDIGKIAVDSHLQRMTDEGKVDGFRVTREHVEMGGQILGKSRDPILAVASRVAMYHHAWWNGSGYPAELGGEAIPLEARICCIANIYISLRFPVHKQQAWNKADALHQVASMAGVQIDPKLTEVFLSAISSLDEVDLLSTVQADWCALSTPNEAKSRLLNAIEVLNAHC